MRVARLWLVVASSAFALAAAAQAQDAPPARNGNVFNGTAHEPDASATTSQERAAGVAPSPGQQQNERNELETLDKQVQKRAETPTGAAAGCSADRTTCASQ